MQKLLKTNLELAINKEKHKTIQFRNYKADITFFSFRSLAQVGSLHHVVSEKIWQLGSLQQQFDESATSWTAGMEGTDKDIEGSAEEPDWVPDENDQYEPDDGAEEPHEIHPIK
ncbi:hypothetical protein JTE90_012314 [Oedothorax gibbosus]|uniref:Uncharacterized protein n=1 Tax=Oedothorax gibbosus TaxID=931172 RepID=A0AAV6VK29_9ARAC|nr:hypothetical protein JTE90_012314 [Oedothorax gibbosus]